MNSLKRGLFLCLTLLVLAWLYPPQAGAQGSVLQSSPSLDLSRNYPLRTQEAVELIQEAFQKAQFFNVLEYQEKGGLYVEGSYARLDLKDPTRYLRYEDQSRLYTLMVYVTPDPQDSQRVFFKIKVKNEGVFGRGFNQTVLEKFEKEFSQRVLQFERFRQTDPAEIAKRYLAGESLVGEFGYSSLKIVKLEYKAPGSWEQYSRLLDFMQDACDETQSSCQAFLEENVLNQDAFWETVGARVVIEPTILGEIGMVLPESHPRYSQYLALLDQSVDSPGTALEGEMLELDSRALSQEWQSKGVGSEKAQGIELQISLKNYELLKRSNAFDVNTQEVLMLRRIASKLFPYALRKGLDYQVHMYDDTRPGSGRRHKNNAFTSGGGILYISRSLIQKIDPQDEGTIAAVLAHELGHNDAYHLQRRIMKTEVMNALVGLSSVGDLFVPGISYMTSNIGQLVLAHYSRVDEYEADRLGLYLLYKAGYDPASMERLFEVLTQIKGKQGKISTPYSSHPSSPARLKRIQYLVSHREVIEKTTFENAAEDVWGEK